ncbi:MAG: glycosyltransferase [Wendovervirus sonii]|uniref:Glycosyltransferase n=1 Tax=phage Lak_Megaphage_Sonny TaxID=3109229 RepID=A0ABZ0Z627_9CAUD|nr:MAG: glycosyltransferase [phage Lak_Megaphage_Sonny]
MKKVLYDNQAFDIQNVGGISKQFVNLSKNLKNYIPDIAVEHTDNLFLKEIKEDINVYTNNTLYSLYKVSRQDYDIFHPTYYYTNFLSYIGDKPFVLTIHDMIVEKFSDINNLSDDSKAQIIGKKILSQKCNKIIAVSEHTKKDIINILKVPADKIEVCYNGVDQHFADKEDSEMTKHLDFEYILYVGTRWGTKNFNMLYDEFKNNIHKKYPNLKLVLVGTKLFQSEIDRFKNDGMFKYIKSYSDISDIQLATIYKHAKCFIFPSIYEGFGIPIVEAFMCKCPVLLNNTSCFPEIGKDAALYFNLTNKANDFMEVFDKFMNMSESEVKKITDKGFEYSKEYTWENFAEKVEKVYDEVLANKGKKEIKYNFVKV